MRRRGRKTAASARMSLLLMSAFSEISCHQMNTQNPKCNKQTSAPTEKEAKIKHMYISMWSSMIQMYFRCGRSSCKMPKLMTAHTQTHVSAVCMWNRSLLPVRTLHTIRMFSISQYIYEFSSASCVDARQYITIRLIGMMFDDFLSCSFPFLSFLPFVQPSSLSNNFDSFVFSCNIRFTAAWTNLPKYGFCCWCRRALCEVVSSNVCRWCRAMYRWIHIVSIVSAVLRSVRQER